MSQRKIILIAGPTASGKSALALELASKMRSIIINADALQVYSGLPILTNQPDAADQKKAPHRLYAALNPSEPSSAGKWLALVRAAIREGVMNDRMPIVVGGTGLYFKALLGGLADIPAIPDDIRAQAKKLFEEIGEEKFRHELAKVDADSAAKLAKNDRQRLTRAYEVAAHTGKPIGFWHKKKLEVTGSGSGIEIYFSSEDRPLNAECYLLMPEREALYARCDGRFLKMIKHGAIEEVRAFLKREIDPALPAMKTIGVREIGAYLESQITLDDAVTKAQQATRNYAKRQMTWFRNQWSWPHVPQAMATAP